MSIERTGAAAQKTYRVLILPERIESQAEAGASLLDVLRAHVIITAPCGGGGNCGKCLVDLTVGGKTQRVRACQTRVNADMTVLCAQDAKLQILTQSAPLSSANDMPATPDISGSATPLSAAFDIGTTTLVCSLFDQKSGRELAVCGAKNPQSAYGADVMTRLFFAVEHGGGVLQEAVVSGMNELLAATCEKAGTSTARVTQLTAVGNSAMQALLLGLPPVPLTRPPYAPKRCDAVTVPAASLGLCAEAQASLTFLPLIGGFVGADTTACLLATDFDALEGTTLLVDIGTNGEIVLGNGARSVACSTAAGPAFEGALLHSGMLAQAGAIDRVTLVGDRLAFHVIGGGAPRGLCGSGLIMLARYLLEAGALEENGRLVKAGPLGDQVIAFDGHAAFLLAPASDTASGEAVVLTQKDVRALQLAKGAILAGITSLLDALHIPVDAVDRLLLAGAFGNVLDVPSACAIGLLPKALLSRTQSIGNAALAGARLAGCNPGALEKAAALARNTEHLALATLPDFQDRFLDSLALCAFPMGGDA